MKRKGPFRTVENKTYVKNGVGRLVFAAFSILFEVACIILIVTRANSQATWLSYATRMLALLLVLGIYSQYKTSAMKTPWIILILLFPVLGTTLYLMVGLNGSTRRMSKRYAEVDKKLASYADDDQAVQAEAAKALPSAQAVSSYLSRIGFPLHHSAIRYFSEAKDAFEAQKEAIRHAGKFVFLEYHAIEYSEPWKELEAILVEKVKEGVEVRVFYDDVGSIGFINLNFVKHLEGLGIHCRVFNPMVPLTNLFLNNRDHRKITVVDGKTGFTGGYNIASEYFNLTQPYGHWKDTGIEITGPAVENLTIIFLEMWDASQHQGKDPEDVTTFLRQQKQCGEKAFVQPYSDRPMDDERVGENVYNAIMGQARCYVWFITPYLILTDEMIYQFGLAAKRGVDVRVITPGIPDKKLIYSMTRSYYHALARCGVRIYEYTPGFCHAKMCVCDDAMATCGTINLDYRSLFHHFEDGCFFFGCDAVQAVKKDFEETLKQCKEVTELYDTGRKAPLRFGQLVLRLFAPLL